MRAKAKISFHRENDGTFSVQKQLIVLLSVSGCSFVAIRKESLKRWQLGALSHLHNDGKVQLRFQHLKHHRLFPWAVMGQSVQVQCRHTKRFYGIECCLLLCTPNPLRIFRGQVVQGFQMCGQIGQELAVELI